MKVRRREQLIIALLQQPSLEKAVASIGISLSTAYRMRRHPDFQAEYLQARREGVSEAIARLQQGCNAASTTLLKIMLDPNNPAASRVRAAERVIEHAQKLAESQDREARLQRLEQKIAARDNSNVDELGERQQGISIVEILRSRRARREALAEPVARADGSDELIGQ
jgi:hypothetical protein